MVTWSWKHSSSYLATSHTLHPGAQDTHCLGANLTDQATCAQRTRPDFTEKANSQVLIHRVEGVKLETAQKLKRGRKHFTIVTVKKTPLTSPLPYTAPQAVAEEIRRFRCLASTYGQCSTSILVQAPKGNATAITHLTKSEGCNTLRA